MFVVNAFKLVTDGPENDQFILKQITNDHAVWSVYLRQKQNLLVHHRACTSNWRRLDRMCTEFFSRLLEIFKIEP
jgi:hypothetical protein